MHTEAAWDTKNYSSIGYDLYTGENQPIAKKQRQKLANEKKSWNKNSNTAFALSRINFHTITYSIIPSPQCVTMINLVEDRSPCFRQVHWYKSGFNLPSALHRRRGSSGFSKLEVGDERGGGGGAGA